jgi:hypothetical protein
MNEWREVLITGLLYTVLAVLIATLTLRFEGWLFRYLLEF